MLFFMFLDLFLAYLLHIWHTYALDVFSTWKITLTELALRNAYWFVMMFYMEKAFMAYVCQMCGNYGKTKSKIMEHYQ